MAAPAPAPPPVTPMVVLASAKLNVHALVPKVYEALLNADALKAWWSSEAYVEAALDGRYETNPPEGKQEGVITSLDAPRKVAFTWDLPLETGVLETSVTYELTPRGAETIVHVTHRARELHAHDWGATWQRALGNLKAYLEGGGATA